MEKVEFDSSDIRFVANPFTDFEDPQDKDQNMAAIVSGLEKSLQSNLAIMRENFPPDSLFSLFSNGK